MIEPTFFASAAERRAWLEEQHEKSGATAVGFYKAVSGKPRTSYAEALDEALAQTQEPG